MFEYTPNNFNGHVLRTILSIAYSFALRSGDYVITGLQTTHRTLKFKNIYTFSNNNRLYIQLTLIYGKSNRYHKTEILTTECTCNIYNINLCPYHNFVKLKSLYISYNLYETSNTYLFMWKNKKVVNYYTLSKLYYALIEKTGRTVNLRYKLHGLRFGRITDLRASGCPAWLIEKLARHAPGSVMTYYYTRMSSTEEAQFIQKYLIKYNKKHSKN